MIYFVKNWIIAMNYEKKLSVVVMLLLSSSFAANAENVSNKYKSNGPIEITSDSLEVLQQNHKAIFTGHVVAVQGEVHIKSEKMTVFYKNNDPEKPNQKEKSVASAATENNSIEKIVVEKNVFLTTPEETAKGENGLYDVVNHKIFLNDDVVLTRDKNVLKGDRLVYDFQTGKSELNSPESGDSNKPKQRVKALFIPDSDKKK
jgi:lipopolysaccharide export system protein LptA